MYMCTVKKLYTIICFGVTHGFVEFYLSGDTCDTKLNIKRILSIHIRTIFVTTFYVANSFITNIQHIYIYVYIYNYNTI